MYWLQVQCPRVPGVYGIHCVPLVLNFTIDNRYSRADVKELAGVGRTAKGGPWDTGIVEHDGEFLIFANVGTKGRTGHDYDNRWEGESLRWYHKRRSSIEWPSVKSLLRDASTVHVFWRSSNSAPFQYAGRAKPLEVHDRSPVEVVWSFVAVIPDPGYFKGPDEIPVREYTEGSVRQVEVNVYERDRAARQTCIRHYGLACIVCGLVFEDRYGDLGADYIHVHHIIPISEIGDSYKVDPIEDLRPICPNCHAMVHRRYPPLSIEEVRRELKV